MSSTMSKLEALHARVPLPAWLRRLLAHIQRKHYDRCLARTINHRDIQMDALALGLTHEDYWKHVDVLESNDSDDEASHLMSKLTLARDSLDVARFRQYVRDCDRTAGARV